MVVNNSQIAILGGSGRLPFTMPLKLEDIFKLTGFNTGNLAFWYAVSSHIANPVLYVPWEFDAEIVNNSCSAIVMPAANMINAFQDHGELAKRFERLKVPIAIVGLGTQTALGADPLSLEIKQGTQALLKVWASAGALVGCRGVTTQRFLANHGLHAEIIGCPSNFINPSSEFVNMEFPTNDLAKGAFLHCDYNRKFSSINRKLINIANEIGGTISVQDPIDGFRMAFRDPTVLADKGALSEAKLIFGVSNSEFVEKVLPRLISFVDYPSWSLFSTSFAVSVGTRMHGNMISFQSGVPTALIVHDGRVSELAETMEFPRISIADAIEAESLADLWSHVVFDENAYLVRRALLRKRYFDILDQTGIALVERYMKID